MRPYLPSYSTRDHTSCIVLLLYDRHRSARIPLKLGARSANLRYKFQSKRKRKLRFCPRAVDASFSEATLEDNKSTLPDAARLTAPRVKRLQ